MSPRYSGLHADLTPLTMAELERLPFPATPEDQGLPVCDFCGWAVESGSCCFACALPSAVAARDAQAEREREDRERAWEDRHD